ncbi:putative pollen allergen ole e 6 [Helianthus annuus]|uniref:Putative pollen allergen ole e 6 n=1 Tax=Helianthus annuus TaxID=4232 RepID=A0A251THA7_HELAN|nr:putative pollen allergen ole e 6 [Helianthus annuus]
MASTKVVAVLLAFMVVLVVVRATDNEDQDHRPEPEDYADCEKNCIDDGNASSFCTLKCEKEFNMKGHIARRFGR